MQAKNLLKLIFELGVVARTPRTGHYHVGITNQLTSAAHSYRQMTLAYFMAQNEGADTGKTLKMGLINDFPESRVLNQTFVQKKYFDTDKLENKVLTDQLRNLNGSKELIELHKELLEGKTLEAKIVLDANRLATLVEAKEFVQQGIKIMERWFLDKEKDFKTKTGKELFKVLKKEEIFWWKD
ncbi:MAG: HD domain-containing protein [Candidatus Aenigmatarchaeota archaeon]